MQSTQILLHWTCAALAVAEVRVAPQAVEALEAAILLLEIAVPQEVVTPQQEEATPQQEMADQLPAALINNTGSTGVVPSKELSHGSQTDREDFTVLQTSTVMLPFQVKHKNGLISLLETHPTQMMTSGSTQQMQIDNFQNPRARTWPTDGRPVVIKHKS